MALEESDGAAVPASGCELLLEPLVEGQWPCAPASPCEERWPACPASLPQRPGSRERTRTGQRVGLSERLPPERGQGRGSHRAARVSRSRQGTRTDTSAGRNPYKWLRDDVTSVTGHGQRPSARSRGCVPEIMAAGQGFEPQLPGPEPGVLPLDDPATAGGLYRSGLRPSGSPISSR